MKIAVAMGAVLLGFLLLVASTLATRIFPPTSTWTEEKAARSAEVKARIAYLGGIVNSRRPRLHGGVDPASAKVEFEALKKENEELNAEFQSAQDKPNTLARILKWSGIALAAVGIVGWYAVREP